MAKSDLLQIVDAELVRSQFQTPPRAWSFVQRGIEEFPLIWSALLKEQILSNLKKHADFMRAEPVLLGSLARGEICPQSDLDFLFLGPEEAIKNFVGHCQQQGIKLRSRIPEDPSDLTVGVELWDILGLLDAEALSERGALVVKREKDRIIASPRKTKSSWLRTLTVERKERHKRYDSIQNFLEPSIKQGLGGLRDLDQARLILKAFPELQIQDRHVLDILSYYLKAFLWLRQSMHLDGQGDLLHCHFQPQLASRFGFENYQQLMLFIQRGLSRVSFYSDWILALAKDFRPNESLKNAVSKKKEPRIEKMSLTGLLQKDPGVLNQYRVRRNLDLIWPEKNLNRPACRLQRGRELKKLIKKERSEKVWLAIFRSRLMDRLIPELKPLVGYVQHDQYHRFTADAHILQVIRETLKAIQKPRKVLGPLAVFAKNMNESDWQMLLWTALYHDLAKGRPGEHSEVGEAWALRDLKAFGLSLKAIREVTWLVRNHLIFSEAALRRDASDAKVLTELEAFSLDEARVRRLLVFTALDIRGTNPQTWNDWKASLLAQLGKRLLSNEHKREVQFRKRLVGFTDDETQTLFHISSQVGEIVLRRDLSQVIQKKNKSFLIMKKNKQIWLRYHLPKDHQGALADILGLVFQAGASVLRAHVMTPEKIGIYDWFCLEGFSGSTEAFLKRIEILSGSMAPRKAPEIPWEQVEVVSETSTQVSIAFRCQDQRGVLWAAAAMLSDAGFQIESASVQTWGRKAEDFFVVRRPKNFGESLLQLKAKCESPLDSNINR